VAADLPPATPLSALAPGEGGRVVALAPACGGPQRRRLLDLGVVPGTWVVHELAAPGGDPMAFRIRGALIALRRDQAALVHVERLGEAPR
jgi:Fe2+ transport system protein FeoA